jgi:hypothetical protein
MIELRAGGFKSSVRVEPIRWAGLAAIALTLAACGGEPVASQKKPAPETAAEAGYMEPPRVTAVRATGAVMRLEGSAAPGAKVRIASPAGDAQFAQADAKGRWSANVTPAQPVNLYGLSMKDGERMAQAEGYVLVAANGAAAQLRAGAGAVALAPASKAPRILAIDYDRGGGAVVSGVAAPGVELALRVDRARRGETKADSRGRFVIPLAEPLKPGLHAFEVAGQGGEDVRQANIGGASRLTGGPYAGVRTDFGWRVDWMTPGGGEQTTLLFERPAA